MLAGLLKGVDLKSLGNGNATLANVMEGAITDTGKDGLKSLVRVIPRVAAA